jgi:hypothetical protein
MRLLLARMSRTKLRPDVNEIAFRTMQAATGTGARPTPAGEQQNPEAAKRGRKGGKAGGKARAVKLTAKRRRAIARKAAKSRWQNPT